MSWLTEVSLWIFVPTIPIKNLFKVLHHEHTSGYAGSRGIININLFKQNFLHGEEAHRFFSMPVSPRWSLTLRANTRHCNASDVKTWFCSSMFCAAPVSHGRASHCCFWTNQQHVKCNIFITFFFFKALWILKFFWLSLRNWKSQARVLPSLTVTYDIFNEKKCILHLACRTDG